MRKSSVERLKEYQIKSGYKPITMEYMDAMLDRTFPSFLSDAEVKELKKQVWAEYGAMLKQRPTEYQDPSEYFLIQNLFQRIHDAAVQMSKDNDFTFPEKLTYGTAEIRAFTAFVEDSDNSKDYLLLISSQLFTFANLLAKSIGMLTISQGSDREGMVRFCFNEDHIKQSITENHEAILRFADLVFAYALTNRASSARQYNVSSEEHMAITSLLRDSFELFIVGHEYSHLLLGHLQEQPQAALAKHYVQLNDEKIELIMTNWSQEVNADILAAYLTITAQKRYDFSSAYVGVDYCLIALIILERLETQLKGKSLVPVTHPPAEIRRELVYEELCKVNPGINGLYESNSFIIDELWKRCMFLLESLNDAVNEALKLPLVRIPYRVTQGLLYRLGDLLLDEYDKDHS